MSIVSAPSTAGHARSRSLPAPVAGAAGLLADPRRALLVAIVMLSAVVGVDPLGDPDVWWHVLLGQWTLAHHHIPVSEMLSYTAAGVPLVPHEWLSSVLFALVYGAGGLFSLALVMGAVTWSGMIAIAVRGRARGASLLAVALGVALAAKAAQPVLGTRPQVFTFALVCWSLWIADRHLRRGGRTVLLLPPMFLLWANLHAGFVAGIAVLAITTAAELMKRALHAGSAAPASRVRILAAVTAVCALVACVNPAGPAIYAFALSDATVNGAKGIVEWQPPNFGDAGMWALLALLVSFVALAGHAAWRRHLDARDAALGAVGCVIALVAVRNASLCVALVAPVWMTCASDLAAHLAERRVRRAVRRVNASRSSVTLGVTIVAAALIAVGYAGTRASASAQPAGIASVYPACSAGVLARAPAPQRVFTAYFDGGYLAYRLWPHALVFAYGESDALSLDVFGRYYRIAADAQTAPTALQLLDTSGTTAVLYPAGALTAQLSRTPGWTHVMDDGRRQLFVRGDARWAAGASC